MHHIPIASIIFVFFLPTFLTIFQAYYSYKAYREKPSLNAPLIFTAGSSILNVVLIVPLALTILIFGIFGSQDPNGIISAMAKPIYFVGTFAKLLAFPIHILSWITYSFREERNLTISKVYGIIPSLIIFFYFLVEFVQRY